VPAPAANTYTTGAAVKAKWQTTIAFLVKDSIESDVSFQYQRQRVETTISAKAVANTVDDAKTTTEAVGELELGGPRLPAAARRANRPHHISAGRCRPVPT